MNLQEQKEPEQKEPEQKEPEQKNQVTEYFRDSTSNLTVDWRHNPIPCSKKNFAKNQELLKANFDTIKKITKLRDENKKIERTIHRQLIQLDRERKEFKDDEENEKREYEKCKKRLDMRVTAIASAVRDCSEDKMVSLNIGGKVFLTLKSTVSNISPFFACLFSDDWGDTNRKTIRDKDGNIFIDRSPQYFEYLLDWSRNGGNTQELINIVQAISGPNWADKTGLSTELNVKTFMKTLEYYGIDHETIDTELAIGNALDIYWRGDKRTYKGTVEKSYFDKEEQELYVIINYEDDTSWKYKINKFDKTSGPYGHLLFLQQHTKGKKTKWWHYGEDKGAIKIIPLNPRPSCSCRRCASAHRPVMTPNTGSTSTIVA